MCFHTDGVLDVSQLRCKFKRYLRYYEYQTEYAVT